MWMIGLAFMRPAWLSVIYLGDPSKRRRIEQLQIEPGTHRTNGVNPRAIAVGRTSRPNPSANPVGGQRKKGSALLAGRSLLRAALVGAASVAVLLPASVAHADPTPAQIEKQINDSYDQLELVIESYNKINDDLAATQAALAALQTKMAPLQASVDTASANVNT